MYINGHIYRIICLIHPKIQYVGSTFNELRHRWQSHKSDYKKYLNGGRECAIYPYFEQYGIENFKMIKIKDYIVYAENKKDHKHLSAYEQLWINKLKCVNKNAAFNPLKFSEQEKTELLKKKRVENLTPEQIEKQRELDRIKKKKK